MTEPGPVLDDDCADYEYDEAHDAAEVPSARQPEPERPVRVEVPDGSSGDYGYDLAHDVR